MTPQDLSMSLSATAARLAPHLVAIEGRRARASGFVWKPSLIVTADDALPEEGDITATFADGSTSRLTVVGRDATTDVALLKTDRTDVLPIALSSTVPPVAALALTLGRDAEGIRAAWGAVSVSRGSWRSMRGGDITARVELDLRLGRSAAGSLAVDASGNAFGMAVHGPRRRVVVIPAATIERVASRLETHGRIARGYLGLGLQPVAVQGGSGVGAMVVSVDAAGPGAAAGLHQGDVLIAFDGKPITGVGALVASLGPDSVGRTVIVTIRRGGEARDVSLTIAERPAT